MAEIASYMFPEIERLNAIVDGGGGIVFFGGAGVSTESGIPDFRSAKGLYSKKEGATPPEQILSHSYFISRPLEFYNYYRKNILHPDAEPNKAHIKLAELEKAGKLLAVVTQNIDGLHQKAGSVNVVELHGSVHRNYCVKCRKAYDMLFMASSHGIPTCGCGGIIKPDVTLYGENLDRESFGRAINYISGAGVLIIGGTSLAVYPAAGLIDYYRGDKLVIINMTETGGEGRAALVIRGSIGGVMESIGKRL